MNFFTITDILQLIIFIFAVIYSFFTEIPAPDTLMLSGIMYCLIRILLKQDAKLCTTNEMEDRNGKK